MPCAEGEVAGGDGDGEGGGRQGGFDVGGHVVGALGGVGIEGIVFGDKPVEPVFEICPGGGVGVFLDGQAGGCVPDHDRAEAFVLSGFMDGVLDFSGDVVEALTCRLDCDCSDHGFSFYCLWGLLRTVYRESGWNASGALFRPCRGFLGVCSFSHGLRRGLESFAPIGAVFDGEWLVFGWEVARYSRRPQGADATLLGWAG